MMLRIKHNNGLYYNYFSQTLGYVWLLILLPLMCQCVHKDKVVYSEYVDIPSDGWPCDEYCEFATAETDSMLFNDASAKYDVMLSIRHTGSCPYSELFLPVLPLVDSCPAVADTLHIRLDDGEGGWRGAHSVGIYTVTDTLLKSTVLPPLYGLRLFHAMPCEKLTGLLSVGLIIEKNNN